MLSWLTNQVFVIVLHPSIKTRSRTTNYILETQSFFSATASAHKENISSSAAQYCGSWECLLKQPSYTMNSFAHLVFILFITGLQTRTRSTVRTRCKLYFHIHGVKRFAFSFLLIQREYFKGGQRMNA